MKSKKGPGKAHRKGISMVALLEMFPNDEAASPDFSHR